MEEAKHLQVHNTLSGKKETFEPLNAPFVGMYVCGPTVYSNVHLGNCRTFISFDLIYRYLQHLGYNVRYVRNITDAGHLVDDADDGEDKVARKAQQEKVEPMQIVQRYTLDFHDVMGRFNAKPPDIEPTATGHVIEQIEMTQAILDKGLAYEVNGSVYFDVKKYNETSNYGKLSGRNIEDLMAGTRDLDGQSEKRDSLDFALWKKAAPEHIMQWTSPWGKGFPGWHLECSVMSSKYLGEQFDIHGGGMDLKFPHHECEVAQCNAANEVDPVKYWLHTNMLTLNGQRMAKSTGNTILPGELFSGGSDVLKRGYDPMVVRFFMMQAHYRSTLDFSDDALEAAEKGFERLMAGIETLRNLSTSDASSIDAAGLRAKGYAAMNDDFNTPVLIAHLFDGVKMINSIADGRETIHAEDHKNLLEFYEAMVFDVLGLKVLDEEAAGDTELVDSLMNVIISLRQDARQEKNWGAADKIRDSLGAVGITIKDGKEGATWEQDS